VTRVEVHDDLAPKGALAVRDAVDDIASRILDAARREAPDARVWVTAHDERVRQTHVDADAQIIPTNVRFILDKVGQTGHELARAPRDPMLSQANSINCRCVDVKVPGVIAASFRRTGVEVVGVRASARVYSDFPRVVESEFPSQGDSGGGWAARALNHVATQVRASGGRG
jgi:hypothetical protein